MKPKLGYSFTSTIILCIIMGGFFMRAGVTKSACQGEENRLMNLSFIAQSSQLGGDFATHKLKTEGNIRFWSINDGKLETIIRLTIPEFAPRIAVSHDGSLIAVALFNISPQLGNDVGCYSIKEKKWLWKYKWVEDRPPFDRSLRFTAENMIFTPDDRKIIAAGVAYLVISDARTGEVLERRREPFKDYPGLYGCEIRNALSPSSRYLAIWQEFSTAAHGQWWKRFRVNKLVTIWDIEENKFIASWKKQESQSCAAVFSADEKEIVFCSNDGYIRVWSIIEQKVIRQWQAHSKSTGSKDYPFPEIHFLTLSPDGKYLATKGIVENGQAIKIWDFLTGRLVHEFGMKSGGLNCGYPMAFSPNGKYFGFERCGNLCLYDTQTWQEKWCIPTYTEGKD
jgi:WD40 repeat protein